MPDLRSAFSITVAIEIYRLRKHFIFVIPFTVNRGMLFAEESHILMTVKLREIPQFVQDDNMDGFSRSLLIRNRCGWEISLFGNSLKETLRLAF